MGLKIWSETEVRVTEKTKNRLSARHGVSPPVQSLIPTVRKKQKSNRAATARNATNLVSPCRVIVLEKRVNMSLFDDEILVRLGKLRYCCFAD